MNLANDERIRKLNDQIQIEKDPVKFGALVEELCRLLDELSSGKNRINISMGTRVPSSTSPSDESL